MTSPMPPYPSSSPASHVQSVLGMAAFMCSIACTRYAKDADKAPSMGPRVELLRMSAERVAAFDAVNALAREAGVDASAGAEPFIGSLGDFDERLRPLDWEERLIKTYLAFGLLLDFSEALVDALDEPLRTAVLDVLGADRFGAMAATELLDDVAGDPQLAARLGLWGRRVVGEEIGTLRRMLSAHPELLGGGADAEALYEVLSQGATSRMRGPGGPGRRRRDGRGSADRRHPRALTGPSVPRPRPAGRRTGGRGARSAPAGCGGRRREKRRKRSKEVRACARCSSCAGRPARASRL